MAKYTITYRCGHSAEIELFGKMSEREQKIEYYKTIECPECKVNSAKLASAKMGLPELEGSERQIAWAIDIRMKAYNDATVKMFAEKFESFTDEQKKQLFDNIEQAPKLEIKLAIALKTIKSAQWWINNR